MRARRVARGRVPSAVRTGVGGAHVYMATWRSRAPLGPEPDGDAIHPAARILAPIFF
jgi:hypothetical protein